MNIEHVKNMSMLKLCRGGHFICECPYHGGRQIISVESIMYPASR